MLSWLIRRRIAAFEKQWGYDASYMREILDVDTRAFFKFVRTQGIGAYRRDIPVDAYYAARLIAGVTEDCGPCTQLVVGMAIADGVAPATIAAVLERREDDLPEGPRLVAQFAYAALAHDAKVAELRESIIAKWGPRALVSIAFAIVAGRIYPTIKYALGHGVSCQRVTIAGQAVTPTRAA
jgi:hypothetical protein